MSEVIDQRVVEMEFDNGRFEKNVGQTMDTLEKFKKTLNFEGATKGFENIDMAAKKMDFSSMASAIESVKGRFQALEVAAITVMVNLTNAAINAGKRIVSALTVAPVMDGFREYEMVLNAVQTTMAGTGKTMQQVENELGRLDEYADKTVYSTRDMLQSLPKFTNAGVKLEPAVTAMIGIANATALAGGGAQQASIAFYNMGQSIGTGYLTRMDYNSLNLAGTATMEWKNQMVEAAIAAGTLTKTQDGLFKAGKKTFTLQSLFIDGLQEQWASTDVMMKVWQDYGDATTEIGKKAWAAAQDIKTFSQMMETLKASAGTGWKETWQILVGDLEGAKKLWTGLGTFVNSILSASAKARNELLQGWVDRGGMKKTIKTVQNLYEAVMSIVRPIRDAFMDIFPPILPKHLAKFSRALYELTQKLKLGEEASENLKRTFKGFFAFLKIIGLAIGALSKFVEPLWNLLLKVGGAFLKVTGAMGDWMVKVYEFIQSGDIFNKAVNGIILFLTNAVTAVKNFIASIKEKFQSPGFEAFHKFLENIHTKMSELFAKLADIKFGVVGVVKDMGDSIKNSKLFSFFKSLWETIKTVGGALGEFFGAVIKGLGKLLGSADYNTLFTVINGVIKGGIGISIIDFIKKLGDSVQSYAGIGESFKKIFSQISEALDAFKMKQKAGILQQVAISLLLLAAALFMISRIDSEKLGSAIAVITLLFGELMGTLAIFNKIVGPKGAAQAATTMITISAAILILSIAVKKVGELNFGQAMTGLFVITTLLAAVVASMLMLQSNEQAVIKGASQMILIAVAIKVLASACSDLAVLPWKMVIRGLVGVVALLAAVMAFMKFGDFSGMSVKAGLGMIAISVAIKILASACAEIAKLDWEQIGKSLAAIGGLLLELALFSNLVEGGKGLLKAAIAMVVIGAALKILVSVLAELGGMDWDVLKQGLKGLAWSLGIITLAISMIPKGTVSMGLGLILVSTALLILAKAIGKIGEIPYNNLNNAIKVMAWSLGLLVIALNAMTGTISGSFALLIAVGALNLLVPVLTILGAMSWAAIIKGLVGLAGAFAIIGLAGLILKPIIGSIIGLGVAITFVGLGLAGIGLGLILAGTGLSLIAVGITALAGSLAVGATAIVAALGAIIVGVINLIPQVIDQFGLALAAFLNLIIEQAPLIAEAILTIVVEAIKGFGEIVPLLAETLLTVISDVLKSLADHTPEIVDSVFRFLIGILEGIAKNLPSLIQAGVDVLMALFQGVVDALGGIDVETALKGVGAIALLSGVLLALAALSLLVPFAMLGVLGFGVVIAELAFVLASIGALSKIPGLSWMIEQGGNFLEVIGVAIGKFLGGIAGGVASGISSQFPSIGTSLSQFMTNAKPFFDGAKQIDSKMVDGVKSLAEAITALTAANIFESIASWLTGSSSMTKFGEELAKFGPYFKKFYDSIKGMDSTVVTNSTNAANALAAFAKNIPNAGGVVGWFTGENSLSAFADELIKFGPKLKAYADSVSGLDSNVVNNSANAAQALAAMALSLPNSGGVASWFAGDNSLSGFAEELTKFGPLIKQYASSVRGLDSNVIINSANAAQALSTLATNLPNVGGVVSWFAGDNDMSDFGDGLVIFGQKMVEYSNSVKDLDSGIITKSVTAATALVTLQNGITKEGGLFSKDSDLKDFGGGLASFGKKMSDYYTSVQNIDFTIVSSAIKEAWKLVWLIKGMSGIETSGPNSFVTSLSSLATIALDAFVTSFSNSYEKTSTALSTFFTNLQTGISTRKIMLLQAFSKISEEIITIFTTNYTNFTTIGQKMVLMMVSGAKSKDLSLQLGFLGMINTCVTAMRNKYPDFYNVGKYFVEGFCNGISNNVFMAKIRAEALAIAALEAARKALKEHSPSKETYMMGVNFVLGFVNAIKNGFVVASLAGRDIANKALTGANNVMSKIVDAIDSKIDYNPVIKPIIDLSNIDSGAKRIGSMLSFDQALAVAGSINAPNRAKIENTQPIANSYFSFTQNNTSPEALDNVEIYRQTKNLISITKDVVKI